MLWTRTPSIKVCQFIEPLQQATGPCCLKFVISQGPYSRRTGTCSGHTRTPGIKVCHFLEPLSQAPVHVVDTHAHLALKFVISQSPYSRQLDHNVHTKRHTQFVSSQSPYSRQPVHVVDTHAHLALKFVSSQSSYCRCPRTIGGFIFVLFCYSIIAWQNNRFSLFAKCLKKCSFFEQAAFKLCKKCFYDL